VHEALILLGFVFVIMVSPSCRNAGPKRALDALRTFQPARTRYSRRQSGAHSRRDGWCATCCWARGAIAVAGRWSGAHAHELAVDESLLTGRRWPLPNSAPGVSAHCSGDADAFARHAGDQRPSLMQVHRPLVAATELDASASHCKRSKASLAAATRDSALAKRWLSIGIAVLIVYTAVRMFRGGWLNGVLAASRWQWDTAAGIFL